MRMVEVTKNFNRAGIDFKQGKYYVMPEDVESQYRSVVGDCLGISQPIDSIYKKYNGEDLTGKKIMMLRFGGVGDMSFLSPVFRYLKKKYPGVYIRMASGCKEPLENLPEIDDLHPMPFPADLFNDMDYELFFQGILEGGSEKSKTTHAVDMFFSYFNIDSVHIPPEDKRPRLVFTDPEIDWVQNECKKLNVAEKDYVIGLQMETSSPVRNYPRDRFKMLIDILSREEDVKIFLIGSAQQAPVAAFLKGDYPNVIAAVNYDVRQSIVLLNRYNLVIAPDSFMIQAAGAMSKPLIGLYGPFSSEVRMKYFKNAIGIEPKVVCSPCFKHDYRACIKGFPSPCFSLVRVEEILQAINYQRKKFFGGNFNYMKSFIREPNFSEIGNYFMSADKGICFFPGYYKHENMTRVDLNKFVEADITDLSQEFKRESYPFVLYMNNFGHQNGALYNNTKSFVRPGGYFIAYKDDCNDQFFNELKRDVGKDFVMLYSKLDPVGKTGVIVGRKPF